MTQLEPDTWQNCYDQGWGDLLIPAAFAHPAKMSRSLVFKIIAHALEEKWIQPGQTVLDPFGGVGTTALPTLMAGLNYIGVELEPRFVELGRQNIALWNGRFSGMPKWTGSATLLQGDSRRLGEVIKAAGIVVSSPPFHDNRALDDNSKHREWWSQRREATGRDPEANGGTPGTYGQTPGQLATLPPGTPPAAIVSSPPFAGNTGGRGDASRNGIDPGLFDRHSGGMKKGTGSDPANLDHLKMGTPPTAIVSSPPYADGCAHTGGDDPNPEHIQGGKNGVYGVDSYGQTDGQLGAMKAGLAVVGSPPFENSTPVQDVEFYKKQAAERGRNPDSVRINGGFDYGSTAGQIGATQGDTFWASAKTIIDQCYDILPPNAYAIWVVKNYVKAGREVDFTGQWQALCEACGFETVHIHRAMLVKEHAAQKFMVGGIWITNKVSRKSFFRRLAEKNGSPPIDFESVLCMRKAA